MTSEWLRTTITEGLLGQRKRRTQTAGFLYPDEFLGSEGMHYPRRRPFSACALAIADDSEVRACVLTIAGRRHELVEGRPIFGDFPSDVPLVLDRYDPHDGALVIDGATDACDAASLTEHVSDTSRTLIHLLDPSGSQGVAFEVLVARPRRTRLAASALSMTYDTGAGGTVTFTVSTRLLLRRFGYDSNDEFGALGEVAPPGGAGSAWYCDTVATAVLPASQAGTVYTTAVPRGWDALHLKFAPDSPAPSSLSAVIEVVA